MKCSSEVDTNFKIKHTPKEVVVQDKAILEQVELIQELEPDEKTMIFKMIDTFINQKKFKDFVKQMLLYKTQKPRNLRGFFYYLPHDTIVRERRNINNYQIIQILFDIYSN